MLGGDVVAGPQPAEVAAMFEACAGAPLPPESLTGAGAAARG